MFHWQKKNQLLSTELQAKKQLRPLLTFILMILVICQVEAREKIPKFGKVDQKILSMTSFPDDPDADAVVIFDDGQMRIMDDFVMVMKRHFRIKILTEKGKEEFSDFRIPYYHEDRIRDFKAMTISPKGRKSKLDKKSINEDKTGNYHTKIFAMPAVEVGSVIDISYKLSSKYLTYLEPWYFQKNAYTMLSQVSAVIKPGFSYTVFFANTNGVEPTEEDFLEPGRKMKRYTWAMRNLPPIRNEPYMRTLEDYMAALHFQLKFYKDNYNYIEFIKAWPDVVATMEERYRPFLDSNGLVRTTLANNVADSLAPDVKAAAIYNYVRNNIETEFGNGMYPERKPEKVLKESKGTVAEKNLLLINMLREAGFKVDPVLISTRSNGLVHKNQPRLLQFNRVVAFTRVGYKPRMFDTGDKNCPSSLLPVSCLVEDGLVIKPGKEVKWIKVPKPRLINMAHCSTVASVSAEGDLTAEATLRYEGYRSYGARNALREADSESDYVEELLKNRFGEAKLDSFSIHGRDDIEEPLRIKMHFSVAGFAQTVGDMVYLGAPMIFNMDNNPLEREKRYFPVEFPYGRANTDEVTLTLPEGFSIAELPENTVVKKPKLRFVTSWSAEGNTITYQRQFMRNKVFFKPSEYQSLRSFYDRIVNADQDQIAIRSGSAGVAEEGE